MIDIIYNNEGIKILTQKISNVIDTESLPLNVQIRSSVSGNIVWETKMGDNMWATYPDNELNDVFILDSLNNIVLVYRWDVIIHGSLFHKTLWYYCLNLINKGIIPNGLVIGSHDGAFGEWVPVAIHKLSNCIIVEGSEKQFNGLKRNYIRKENTRLVKNIITPDGGSVIFYEGGRGYTNSVVERVIRNWEKEEIHETVSESIGINDLINNYFVKKPDWIHLDVEGLDVKLLMSIKEEYLPNLIIYEDANLIGNEKYEIIDLFSNYGYTHLSKNGIAMFVKK